MTQALEGFLQALSAVSFTIRSNSVSVCPRCFVNSSPTCPFGAPMVMADPQWMTRRTFAAVAAAMMAERICIGSDFDGGFGLQSIPPELDSIADLQLIASRLMARGYSESDAANVLGGNWLRFLREHLPA